MKKPVNYEEYRKHLEESRRARREKLRSKGLVHYIVFRSIPIYGLMAFADCLVSALLSHKHLDSVFFLSKIACWLLAGLFLGWIMWRREMNYPAASSGVSCLTTKNLRRKRRGIRPEGIQG
ncbi:MAG: hypothetical protein P4K83_00875 [Terracidiphilus sp.]|nr:hypothetical protein [Terracidiphilus sp.]